MAKRSDGIFSLRLVIADFYMEKPIQGFDPCYSEFRGKEIKRVPVIRVFGSNAQGQKCCMHIHGVFPYLYIPYDQKDFESANRAIYQIAMNIDKAINISLGQGSSQAHHVFKVQLVKGIPFYGYHRSEHQYLKIYMFNPRFIRRAANLLQNGAILNKNFHPHESHVPYILQFMIDYNLYGMSFLHVPLEIVKFRKSNPLDQIPFDGVDQAAQSLDCELAKKVSCSSLELDISSSFILNRFELALKNKKVNHTNPGIESIWNDEKLRRQKMAVEGEAAENKIPPLEIPASQERPNILPTDSEIFYRTGLVSKLLALAETSTVDNSQTINCTLQSNISNTTLLESINQSLTKQQHKRTFNLTKMLQNAVYPEECTQNSENLINASFVENHLSSSSGSAFQQSFMQEVNQILNPKLYDNENNRTWEADESVFMDDTIVDEQLVLSLTQQQCSAGSQHISSDISLRPEDIELLDILQQLEENNEDDKIDLDSSLAPLSQADKNFEQSPKLLDMETRTAFAHSAQIGSDNDSETDDNPHDFSIALDNLDDLILKLTQTQDKIKEEEEDDDNGLHPPQIDGADDSLQRTPTKSSVNNNALKTPPRTPTTPSRRRLTLHSPRTPKSAHKFAAIPMLVTNRSTGKTILDTTKLDNATPIRTGAAATGSLRKKVAVTELRRKTISLDRADFIKNDLFAENTTGSHKRRSKRLIDLDKTHVTCALTPRRTNEKMLKVYSIDEENNAAVKSLETKVTSDKILADKNPMTTKQIRNLNIKRKDEATASTISHDSCRPDADTNHGNFNKNIPADNVLDSESNTHKDSIKEQRSKTPNLKRLRHSFSKTAAKPRELRQESQTIVSGEVINSSKFLQNSNELSNSAKEKSPSLSSHTNEQQEKMSRIETKRVRVKLTRLSLRSNRKFKEDQYREAAEDSSTSNLNSNEHKLPKNKSLIESSTENTAAINHLDNNEKDAVELSLPPDDCTSHGNDELQKSTNFLENSVSSELLESLNTIIQQSYQQLVTNSLAINDDAGDTSSIYDRTTSPLEDISCIQQHSSDDDEISATPPRNVPEYKTQRLSNLYDRTKSAKHSPALFLESSSPVFSSNAQLEHNSKSGSKESASSHITLLSSNNTDGGRENQVFASATSGIGPADVLHLPSITTSDDVSTNGDGTILITPLDLPPSREEVLKGCIKFQLPEYEFQKPYYSNPDDITKQKEIGFTVLHIQGNKLNDVEEFQSVLGTDCKGINQWRKQKMMELGGPELLNRYRNPQRIREYLATSKSVCITPQMIAPTRQEAKLWLKARELLKNKDEQLFRDMKLQIAADEDSPIKIRRQKVTLMLNDGTEGAGNASGDSDCDETLNCSATHSLTLTPATPEIPKSLRSSQSSCTPVTTKIEKIPLEKLKIPRRNNRRVLRRISLNRKFQTILEQASPSSSPQQQQQQSKMIGKSQEVKDSQESVIPNSQCSGNASSGSSSITSQQALNEMEKSSFMKNIKQSTKKNLLEQSLSLSDNTTLNNSFGFKVALENLQQAKSDVEYNYLTTIALEVFVCTRHDLFPNPEIDEIHCLFYAIENSIPTESHQQLPRSSCGYIMVSDIREKEGPIHGIDSDIQVTIVHTEIEALEALLGLCARWDPDIYAGYEIEMSSWGFVIERAKHLCLNIAPLLSRVPSQKSRDFVDEDREQFTDLDVDMKLCGRILLDVWRLMRSEIALTSYSFENVMYHIMHKRCPWHSYRSLTQWYTLPCTRWIVIEYYLERVRGTMALLDQLDLLGRTSEMAKLIGIQFYEVLSRGSQFRVESMMLRIGKPKNLVPLSPSVQQRAHMRAPEYLALILEPQSRFYEDPLIVLDFQSLYPSMIIAYNYCFSTCLGRVEHLGQSTPFEFGASQLRVSPAMLRKLIDRDLVTISPCGVVFVKSTVREGILPRMLTEILDTRQMVKQSMKLHKSNSALQRILHSRQLGLKLMANVTYGYTAANFSGRMPCVEVGDSVVAKGRETLERAIKLVETNEKWNVKVVYGDTDSLFVLVPGRDRAEAFRIGEEIVEAVTKQNPLPVKLKLEKVYQPCILQTKKRYVGYMYETPDQKEPVYEAKGIETVRRDGCPIVAKMLEKVLRILFETADVSQVKQYVCRQFTKLLSGKANIQDLIFAKEFRGLNGYKANACVPALELTRKWIQTDPRRIPRRGERLPFIITNGPPGLPLIRLIKHPHEVLAHEGLKINAVYYITKAIIPPLNRCLYLIGADVNEWFANLPRKILLTPALSLANEVITSHPLNKFKKSTISQFFSTTNCVLDCGRQTKDGICSECNSLPSRCMIILQSKISKLERCYLSAQQICQACCGRVGDLECASLDCPVLYVLEVKHRDLKQIAHYRNLLDERF